MNGVLPIFVITLVKDDKWQIEKIKNSFMIHSDDFVRKNIRKIWNKEGEIIAVADKIMERCKELTDVDKEEETAYGETDEAANIRPSQKKKLMKHY